MQSFIKYPRTPHLQPGDDTSGQISVAFLKDGILVWEEKIDGANAAISFPNGELTLQSRGHVLSGGAREAQFSLFKAWASCHERALYERLGKRYILYGEWCFAKHTVFYDMLPHYFLEFDLYDREKGFFLSTQKRHSLLKGSCVVSVPVLYEGILKTDQDMKKLVQPSLYKSADWRQSLSLSAEEVRLNIEEVKKQTDLSDLSEGLYVKCEDEKRVLGRYKYVRADFLQVILDSGSHWLERTLLSNRLSPEVDIFSEKSYG